MCSGRERAVEGVLSARPSWTHTPLTARAHSLRPAAQRALASQLLQPRLQEMQYAAAEEGSIHSEVITSHQRNTHFLIWVTTPEFHSRIIASSSTDTTRRTRITTGLKSFHVSTLLTRCQPTVWKSSSSQSNDVNKKTASAASRSSVRVRIRSSVPFALSGLLDHTK